MSDNVLIKDPNAKFGYRATRVDGRKREQNLEPFNRIAHDYLMENVFTPENAKTATAQADKMLAEPAPFAKGDKVRLALSLKRPEENDDHEIIGFYSNGEVIDENKASPYNNSYGVRVRNLRTGKDYPIMANDLKRIEQEKPKNAYEGKSIKELDELGFYGPHNIIVNKLRNSVYDNPEQAMRNLSDYRDITDEQRAYVKAYADAVFGGK